MEKVQQTTNPSIGAWAKLPTEEVEKKPKVSFDINITVECEFLTDEPREYSGDNGAYYVFDVREDGAEKVIMTSAWTLLRALKTRIPLKGKKLKITKRLVKGKHTFEVI